MMCIHMMNIHCMNIDEHARIWYGYVFMCVQVYQCMIRYISVYLLSSSKVKEQKRKYIIYSACRWIIEFNGTTKRLSRDLCTPLNSSGFHLFIPCWATFHDVFSRLEWRECDGLTGDSFNHSHLVHIWFHILDHGQRTVAATLAVYSSQESPALALEVNLSISFSWLVDTWGFRKPEFSLQLYEFLSSFEVLTHSHLMISKCLITNSHPSVLNEFLFMRHESWHFRTFNTQHVQCYPEDISTATVPCKSKSSHTISMKALPSSTNFWASGYAKMDCPPLLFHISTPKWTKIIRHPKASNLNGCQVSNVHDGLAIHRKKRWESVKLRPMLSNNAWIWDTNSMIIWFTFIHHTQHGNNLRFTILET